MKVSSSRRTKKARYEVEALEGRRLVSASMLKDINTTTSGSDPSSVVAMGNNAYFSATDGIHGRELWKSDGTAAGTMIVKDIVPGSGGSSPAELTVVGNTVFFTTLRSDNTYELWQTDGTDVGTHFVRHLGNTSTQPGTLYFYMRAAGNTLFFIDKDAATGLELWRSDGTPAGTVSLDIVPGPAWSYPSSPTAVNDTLYVVVDTAAGNELWRSDGTSSGTVRVMGPDEGQWKDVNSLINVNGTLYFGSSGPSGDFGYVTRIWKSDGTASGTVRIAMPASTYHLNQMANYSGTLLFTNRNYNGDDELYKVVSPTRVELVTPPTSSMSLLATAGGRFYFRAGRNDLWVTNGTPAGTAKIANFDVGPYDTFYPSPVAVVNDTLYFGADDKVHGRELWRTDGTVAGTVMVKDIASGNIGLSSLAFTGVNGKVFYAATDYVDGNELWTSDGTEAGTNRVCDINATTVDSVFARPTIPGAQDPVILNGIYYFAANDGFTGTELWRTDGTEVGTWLVKDILPGAAGSGPLYLRVIGGTLVFVAASRSTGSATVTSLWKSDGTSDGTTILKSHFHYRPSADQTSTDGPPLIVWNGLLFFNSPDETTDGQYNIELWESDGSIAGTKQVRDIYPGLAGNYSSTRYGATNDGVYFIGNDGTHGQELWKTDGTTAGTYMVRDIIPGNYPLPLREMTAVGNTLFFTLDDGIHGYELWKSDGTASGTVLVKDIVPGSTGGSPYLLTNVDGILYFTANTPTTGTELWKSDGTDAGTVLVKDINPGSASASLGGLVKFKGKLLFRARGPEGYGLWQSDGTDAGTVFIKAASIAASTTIQQGITVVGEKAYFQVVTSDSGYELWQTDGTPGGTVAIPNAVFGSTNGLTGYAAVGNTLFFTVSDLLHGREWWTVQNDPPGLTATPDSVYTFTGPAGRKTLAVTAGTVTLAADLSAAYPSLSITVSGTGAVAINAPQHLAALTLDGPGASATFGGTSDLAGLSFAGGRSLVNVPVEAPTPAPVPPPAPQKSPVLAVGDADKAEGNAGVTLFTFPVTLDRASDSVVKVYFATANQTAAKGSDYTAVGGVLVFKPGETRKTVSVQVKGDKAAEADEMFRVVLYNPAGASVGDGTGVGTIRNDDAPAKPKAFVADTTFLEGNAGTRAVTFDVTLDHAATAAVTLQYATADGTAKAGSDYLAAAGSLTFKPGETRKRVTVYVKGDKTKEADETFFLNLLGPVNADLGDRQGRAVIRNND